MRDYTLHVQFEAEDDAHAVQLASALAALVGVGSAHRLHLTDAQDWAEHVTTGCHYVDVYPDAGECDESEPPKSIGIGQRVCKVHAAHHRLSRSF